MAQTGNERKVYLTTKEAASTGTWLKGETSNSFNRSADVIDISDKENQWRKFITGMLSATAEVTVHLDDTASEQQHKLLKAFTTGASVFVFIGKMGTEAGEEGDSFEAVITAISDSNEMSAVASRSISLQVTGEVTHYPTLS